MCILLLWGYTTGILPWKLTKRDFCIKWLLFSCEDIYVWEICYSHIFLENALTVHLVCSWTCRIFYPFIQIYLLNTCVIVINLLLSLIDYTHTITGTLNYNLCSCRVILLMHYHKHINYLIRRVSYIFCLIYCSGPKTFLEVLGTGS